MMYLTMMTWMIIIPWYVVMMMKTRVMIVHPVSMINLTMALTMMVMVFVMLVMQMMIMMVH